MNLELPPARARLWYNVRMRNRRGKSGQTALEYILVFVALLGILVAAMHFARAAGKSAEKTTTLVTCEYP